MTLGEAVTARNQEKHRSAVTVLLFVFSLAAFTSGYIYNKSENERDLQDLLVANSEPFAVASRDLMSANPRYLNTPGSQFCVVEFGDYQCGPCRGAQPLVNTIATKYDKRVSVTFRHCPLTTIHPEALAAARVSGYAEEYGFFRSVHQQLFKTELSTSSLKAIVADYRLKPLEPTTKTAPRVLADIVFCNKVHIDETPSFFLVMPTGKVFRFKDLNRLSQVLHRIVT